tara:strand:- start:62 stop:3946 length:3885 start_codon:yes stop_codon:yes gene_type:complete
MTFSAAISGSTVTLSGTTAMGTTATALLYRIDLGSKTKIGTFDNVLYKKIKDVDSAVATIDDFDVYRFVSAKYFISVANSDNTQYQNAEITLNVNSAKSDATISQTSVGTGTFDLATFTADVSSGKARLRMAGSPANNEIYVARMSISKEFTNYEATGTGILNFNYTPQFGTIKNTGTITLPTSTDTLVGRATTDTLTNKTLTSPTINGATVTGNVTFNDSVELRLGTGADANIKHTGTNLNVNETTGDINIRTYADNKDVVIGSDDGSGGLADYIIADGSTGEVKLFHYGSQKLKTISTGVQTTGTINVNGAYTLPTADGSNTQVLMTDGAGTVSFADSGGGTGTDNHATKIFNFFKLGTTSKVIDEFDIAEFRGAIYDIEIEDTDLNMIGHLKVSIIHDDSTPYISVYDVNEDSTRICDFTAAISSNKVQLSAVTNVSTHTNLRCHRVALGDHNEQKDATNTKIIKASTAIGSTATTLDQFTKTDYQGVKYIILTKDSTAGEYQISEMSLVHDGTDCFLNDYAKVSSTSGIRHTFSAAISGSTVTLSALSDSNTTATALLYRVGLGSKTILGTFDNVTYGKIGDLDSAVTTVDSFDVFKFKSARYFVNISNSDNTEYQNSEINLVVNSAGTGASISETIVSTETGGNDLATFSADVSGGKARLRMAGSPANNVVYYARLAMESSNIYRGSQQTSDDLYITHNNLKLEPGALTLPKGTTGNRPSSAATGMIRYNTSTDSYERYDTTGWVNIAKTATATEASGTTTGEATSISTSAVNIDTFDRSSFDSAFYQMVTRDEINDEVATQAVSLVHNDTSAFVGAHGIVRSGSNVQVAFDADLSGSTVRLRGTGTADVNSVKFFRIGLGDNTSASESGNTAFVLNSDVDSAVENLDSWSASTYRGAKYYISANNSTKTELTNIECLVVHNGTDAFITIYNDIFTGSNSLLTLTADIDSGNVRLRASGNEANTAVKMYRILLGDSESDAVSDNTKTVGQVSVSSSATAVDTFSTDSYNGAHYVFVGNNSSESAASISEVFVVTDGTDAYVATGPIVSTKTTDQLTFTAALSGSTVTVSAASTSGGSTTVNGYRVQLLRNPAGASTSLSVLTTNAQTISGAKTFTADVTLNDDVKLKLGTGGDLEIYHDGSNSYIDDAGTGSIFIRSGTTYFQNAAGTKTSIQTNAGSGQTLYFNNSEKFQTTNTGIGLTGVMRMAVESGDPSTVSNSAHIYAKDESASAEVYVQDEAGNVTKISPHNEKGEWEYFSRNTKTGKTVRVNMEEMIRDIEQLTGKKYIKEE